PSSTRSGRCDEAQLRRQAPSRTPDALRGGPPFPPTLTRAHRALLKGAESTLALTPERSVVAAGEFTANARRGTLARVSGLGEQRLTALAIGAACAAWPGWAVAEDHVPQAIQDALNLECRPECT